MSTNDGKASGKAQDADPKSDSVYDFLYYDKQRVGSFLGQFSASGHLQQVTESESASKGIKRGFKFGFGGGATVMGTGGQGNLNIERAPAEHGSEGIERIYDPLWANALTLLDYLETANLICRDITTGHLGQFAIASGSLSVLNSAIVQKMWDSPTLLEESKQHGLNLLRAEWAENPRNAPPTPEAKAEAEKERLKQVENSTLTHSHIFPYLTYPTQCTISGKDFSVWSALSDGSMISTVGDLSLKHGTEVPGLWHLLGILDALPSPIPQQIVLVPGRGYVNFSPTIKNLSNIGRIMFGRPAEAYGMTALLLFREVMPGTR